MGSTQEVDVVVSFVDDDDDDFDDDGDWEEDGDEDDVMEDF